MLCIPLSVMHSYPYTVGSRGHSSADSPMPAAAPSVSKLQDAALAAAVMLLLVYCICMNEVDDRGPTDNAVTLGVVTANVVSYPTNLPYGDEPNTKAGVVRMVTGTAILKSPLVNPVLITGSWKSVLAGA